MSEMLNNDVFTRPRRGWTTTIHIKHLLTDEETYTTEEIRAKGQAIATILTNCPHFHDEEVIENFENACELDEFNSCLEDMYEYCDNVRIWVD